jgi:hypothetical protein
LNPKNHNKKYSIRHKKPLFVFVTQSIDTICQSQQRPINLSTLHQPNSSIFSDSTSFGACQVNKGKFAKKSLNLSIFDLRNLVNPNLKHRMTSRRCLIGICGLGRPSSVAHQQQVHNLLGRLSLELSDTSNDDTLLWIVS